jgi:UDP-N-acetylmuramyl pentapeptide synthase
MEAIALLREQIRPDDVVLVKGARVAVTEEIVAALVDVTNRADARQ